MKNAKKIMLLVLCAALLVGATVAGTVAYLTSQAEVKNTFTVGKVAITLDETNVDLYGVKDGDTRVAENDYLLVPGYTYTKDPIVHVEANSENSWVFVKIDNGLEDYVGDIGIDAQIIDNGWNALTGVDGVYYKEYTKNPEKVDLHVFANFTVPAENTQDTDWSDANGKTVVVTAYAIQKSNGTADGFAVADAWTEVNK